MQRFRPFGVPDDEWDEINVFVDGIPGSMMERICCWIISNTMVETHEYGAVL
jgi:hypothetical protein